MKIKYDFLQISTTFFIVAMAISALNHKFSMIFIFVLLAILGQLTIISERLRDLPIQLHLTSRFFKSKKVLETLEKAENEMEKSDER